MNQNQNQTPYPKPKEILWRLLTVGKIMAELTKELNLDQFKEIKQDLSYLQKKGKRTRHVN
jgi:hypothetical protein